MLKRILFWKLFIVFSVSNGQQSPVFNVLRYEDDFSYLKLTQEKDMYSTFKHMSLNTKGTTYLSLGGDIRYQYFLSKNEDWGDTSFDSDGYLLDRFLAHIDFHLGKYFRFFYQFENSNAIGRENPNLVEDNPWDTNQLFIESTFSLYKNLQMLLRVGRQELYFGSQRLVSVRENPNNRLSFEGLTSKIYTTHYKTDFFYLQPISLDKEPFNDTKNKDVELFGSYTVLNNIPIVKNLDLYYLGFINQNAVYTSSNQTVKEVRHSIGTRIWNNKGNWTYDFEGVYQFGNIGQQKCKAWTVSANSSYSINTLRFKPNINLKIDMISGNKSNTTDVIETFNPLFPKGAYFGWAGFIGPSNLIDIHPGIDFEINANLHVSFDYDVFWRYSNDDGIYAPNFQLIYSSENSDEKYIGSQLSSQIIYQLSSHLSFKLLNVWFEAGDFLKESGAGKDIFSGSIVAQLKF